MDIRILNNLFLTIERGNPLKRQDQTIHMIMVYLCLLKCGKMEMESTIDQGNLIDSLQQVFQKWIVVVLGLLKSGKVRLRRTIDQGNLRKLFGI